MVQPSGSKKLELHPKVSGNKITIPLDDLSHRERRTCKNKIKTRLGGQVQSIVINDDLQLVVRVSINSSRRRDAVVRGVANKLCSIIRSTVIHQQTQHQQQQVAQPRKQGARQVRRQQRAQAAYQS